jgi:hypothetical protein
VTQPIKPGVDSQQDEHGEGAQESGHLAQQQTGREGVDVGSQQAEGKTALRGLVEQQEGWQAEQQEQPGQEQGAPPVVEQEPKQSRQWCSQEGLLGVQPQQKKDGGKIERVVGEQSSLTVCPPDYVEAGHAKKQAN